MKCPGQDTRYWDKEAIFEAVCPECGAVIEFFKDDTKRRCPGCGKEVPNPRMDFGCAAYCPYAKECLGAMPEGLLESREELVRERLAQLVKRVAGKDFKLIKRISQTVTNTEQRAKEQGLDLSIVVPIAHLLPIPASAYEKAGLSGPLELLEKAGVPLEKGKKILKILEKISDTEDPIGAIKDTMED